MHTIINLSRLALSVCLALGAPLAPAMAAGDAAQGSPATNQTYFGHPPYEGLNAPGAVLPSSSSGQGEPEPLNSLPPGAEDGTPAMQRHQALQAYRAATEKPDQN